MNQKFDVYKDKCSEGCPGWGVYNGQEIQRCDSCKKFENDEEAIAHVLSLERLDVARNIDEFALYALDEVTESLQDTLRGLSETPLTNVPVDWVRNSLYSLLSRTLWGKIDPYSCVREQFAKVLSTLEEYVTQRQLDLLTFTLKTAEIDLRALFFLARAMTKEKDDHGK